MDNRRCRYKTLSLDKKLKAIKQIENGEKLKDVALAYKIKSNTLSTIYKNRAKLKDRLVQHPASKKFKRIRNGKYANLDKAVITFVTQARQNRIPINGTIIQAKAKQLGELLNIQNFSASAGWLQRLKKRAGLKWKCLTGDAAEADEEEAASWLINVFQPLMAQYNENDVFNADEGALFFKCLPGKTMALKNENCKNEKKSKERITMMVGCNMTGTEKLPMFVIGKSKRPRCFKGVKSLPVRYDSNKNAWMTGYLFEKWLADLDEKFTKENRKVLLFVDNCSAHVKDVRDKLTSIRLEFFPPNLTSILQPMDRGIIRSLKARYRNTLVLKMIDQMERNVPITKVNLLDGINLLSEIWETKVTPTVIKNCFKKAGFIDSHFDAGDDISLSQFVEEQRNYEKLQLLMPIEITDTFEEFVNIDDGVLVAGLMSDHDIVEAVQNDSENHEVPEQKEQTHSGNGDSCSEDEEPEEQNEQNSIDVLEALSYVDKLRIALEKKKNVPQFFFTNLNAIHEFLNK